MIAADLKPEKRPGAWLATGLGCLILLLSISWICLLPAPLKFDQLDEASFNSFRENTATRLDKALAGSLDDFLAEIGTARTFFYSATDFLGLTGNEREKYLTGLWRKHIDDRLDDVIAAQLADFLAEMEAHNRDYELALFAAGVNIRKYDAQIGKDLASAMAGHGLRISEGLVNDAVTDFTVVDGLGGGALWLARLFENAWYTQLLGMILEYTVQDLVGKRLDGNLRPQMRNRLREALNLALNGENSLFATIRAGMETFHSDRAALISHAMISAP